MTTNRQMRALLRRTVLTVAVLLTAAPAALADSPAYLFQDEYQTAPVVHAATAAVEKSEVAQATAVNPPKAAPTAGAPANQR